MSLGESNATVPNEIASINNFLYIAIRLIIPKRKNIQLDSFQSLSSFLSFSPYSYTFNTDNTCSFPARFHCRSSFILLHLFHPIHHLDPLPLSTTPTVLNRILISIPISQFLTYSISSFTTSSKSVISLLPLTCHIPVSPGFTASLPR